MSHYRITFITPLFSRGALEAPEIRPPSIRGQLHWWFRALGGQYDVEKSIFGGVHNGAAASKVVIRMSAATGQVADANTLPHKSGGQASPKKAFSPNTSFDLHILVRRALSTDEEKVFTRALRAWLLLGTLGLRGTRGAGSFKWEDIDEQWGMPQGMEGYEAKCREVLNGAPLRWAILGQNYTTAEDARRVVSDTLGGKDDQEGQGDLARLHDPLGRIRPQRKTSPLRFRIVTLGEQDHHIAAVWDNRSAVTGNSEEDLCGVVKLLARKKPALGRQLEKILTNRG